MEPVIEEFEKFVASQQRSTSDEAQSQQLIKEWLQNLDSLYTTMIEFLKLYIDAGSIVYTFSETRLDEEPLGTYSARQMEISIGRQRVSVEPTAAMLVGCKGRVDVRGAAGRRQLLLVNKTAKSAADMVRVTVRVGGVTHESPAQTAIQWAWKILAKAPQRTFEDLDRESFYRVLMEVAGA